MSRKRKNFVLYMFQQDIDSMKDWVLQYPNKETGGDLFGLWSGEGDNAVIHVVLGPGRGCTHGDYHFYQDVTYLEKVGSLLTENYMLGHIGEWHSHHQLRLDEPSEGDCRTIQRNYPQGSCGFFLMIANIICKKRDVYFSPYIFKAGSRHCKAGEVQVICENSPFSLVGDILEALKNGKEDNQGGKTSKQEKAKAEELQKPLCMGMIYSLFLSDDQVKRESLPVERKPLTSKSGHRKDGDWDSTRSDARRKDCDSASSETMNEANVASSSSVREVSECVYQFQWYTKDLGHEILKGILHELTVDDFTGHVNMQFDDRIQNMIMTFHHGGSTIEIFFPFNFPVLQAKIKLDKSPERIICYTCSDILQFNCRQFVTEIQKMLN